MSDKPKTFLSVQETADRLGLPYSTCLGYVRAGIIPSHKTSDQLGARRLIIPGELDKWLAEGGLSKTEQKPEPVPAIITGQAIVLEINGVRLRLSIEPVERQLRAVK